MKFFAKYLITNLNLCCKNEDDQREEFEPGFETIHDI